MAIYVMTGASTGIGAAAREILLKQGHEVLNVDYKNGDINADLSTKEGRKAALEKIYAKYPDGIDVMICNAGVGPTAPPKTIVALDFFAAVEMAEGVRPLLKKKKGSCVITSSNSITNQTVRMDWVDMISNTMNEERVMEFFQNVPPQMTPSCYSSSKHALARWVRRVSPAWAVDGLRINAVAPGFMVNERSKAYLGTVEDGLTARGEAVIGHTPMGRFGKAGDLLGCIRWLLDDDASAFVTGITVPVDGGFLTLGGV